MFEVARNLHDLHQGFIDVSDHQYVGHHLSGQYHIGADSGFNAGYLVRIGEVPAADIQDKYAAKELKMAAAATNIVENGLQQGMYKKWQLDFAHLQLCNDGNTSSSCPTPCLFN